MNENDEIIKIDFNHKAGYLAECGLKKLEEF